MFKVFTVIGNGNNAAITNTFGRLRLTVSRFQLILR